MMTCGNDADILEMNCCGNFDLKVGSMAEFENLDRGSGMPLKILVRLKF
jgi:hypothetical protein